MNLVLHLFEAITLVFSIVINIEAHAAYCRVAKIIIIPGNRLLIGQRKRPEVDPARVMLRPCRTTPFIVRNPDMNLFHPPITQLALLKSANIIVIFSLYTTIKLIMSQEDY